MSHRGKSDLFETNFKLLELSFSDLIKEIEDGFFGEERSRGPHVKKTIYFHNGTSLTCYELIDTHSRVKRKYQYDWQYNRKGGVWKWHNEPHNSKMHMTQTEPHHQHHLSISGGNERLTNYGHWDLFTIMETIHMHLSIQKENENT